MKKLLISAGALTALALSTPAFAVDTNTATATATVNIVSPVTIHKDQDLNFGTIVGPFAGQTVHVDAADTATCGGLICSGTVTSAAFTVSGTAGQLVKLTIPDSVVLNLQGGTATSPTLTVDFTSDKPADPTLDSTGKASFAFGGSMDIPSTTVDGVYSNTFDVTVEYP